MFSKDGNNNNNNNNNERKKIYDGKKQEFVNEDIVPNPLAVERKEEVIEIATEDYLLKKLPEPILQDIIVFCSYINIKNGEAPWTISDLLKLKLISKIFNKIISSDNSLFIQERIRELALKNPSLKDYLKSYLMAEHFVKQLNDAANEKRQTVEKIFKIFKRPDVQELFSDHILNPPPVGNQHAPEKTKDIKALVKFGILPGSLEFRNFITGGDAFGPDHLKALENGFSFEQIKGLTLRQVRMMSYYNELDPVKNINDLLSDDPLLMSLAKPILLEQGFSEEAINKALTNTQSLALKHGFTKEDVKQSWFSDEHLAAVNDHDYCIKFTTRHPGMPTPDEHSYKGKLASFIKAGEIRGLTKYQLQAYLVGVDRKTLDQCPKIEAIHIDALKRGGVPVFNAIKNCSPIIVKLHINYNIGLDILKKMSRVKLALLEDGVSLNDVMTDKNCTLKHVMILRTCKGIVSYDEIKDLKAEELDEYLSQQDESKQEYSDSDEVKPLVFSEIKVKKDNSKDEVEPEKKKKEFSLSSMEN